MHSLGICHRDIKPQNVLINPRTHVVKICDFGSAKRLTPDESNVSYICSRYYRAPELIFGATNYTVAVDIWSMACVIAELLTGLSLFPGENNVDQMVEIIKVLGTPTAEEIHEMNPNYHNFKFPNIQKKDLAMFKIIVPKIEWQIKISTFLSSLERKAEIEERIQNVMQKQKLYLLQQMFI